MADPMPPTKADDLLSQIVAAAEKATPGQWTHYRNKLRPTFGGIINEVQCGEERNPIVQWGGFDNSDRSERKHAANAKFIALANPANLLAIAAYVEELRKALKYYADGCYDNGDRARNLTGDRP